MICHYCCKVATGNIEIDEENYWVYCPDCDVWTCHPIEEKK